MPLDNNMIEKLNEMTLMVSDKSNLAKPDTEYIKSIFYDILKNGTYDTEEISSWLENEGSWKNAQIKERIVNLAHYAQTKYEQSDKFRMIKDDSCSCGGSC